MTKTNYIKFNKGNIDKLPNPDKRGARYYHEEIKGLHIEVMPSGKVKKYNTSS